MPLDSLPPLTSPQKDTAPSSPPSDAYDKFLLAEYSNIAQAFFNSGTTITQFFQFYLLVLTVPITLAGVVVKVTSGSFDVSTLPGTPLAPFLASFLLVIALAGLCMMAYIISMRLDALLYARSVNGIRKYFTERSRLPFEQTLPLRTLPTSTFKPNYYEPRFFLAVVVAFAIMNTLYATVSIVLLPAQYPYPWDPIVPLAFFVLHFLIYWALIAHRRHFYLRARVIGVDIDGVIGNHRLTFARMLQEVTGKEIDASAIKRVPVHTQPELGVSEDDEHAVFNQLRYWQQMDIYPNAAKRLSQLRNAFGFRIHIFSYRPWPNEVTAAPEAKKQWKESTPRLTTHNPKGVAEWLGGLLLWVVNSRRLVGYWTKVWLRGAGITWDKLVIERGSAEVPDPLSHSNNRFTHSMEGAFRIFVEDELPKARKLANTVELVFLFDQPYNQSLTEDLAPNIVRVSSWDDIYNFVRERV